MRKRIVADRILAAGMAALERQDWSEACEQLRQYLLKYPDEENILLRYAEANMSCQPRRPEHISAAIGGYRRYLRNQPGNEHASNELARLYFAVGNHVDCAYIARQRLQYAPDDIKAIQWLARSLITRQQHDEARELLVKCVEQHPHEIDAYDLLSLLALQDGSDTAANESLEWLNKAVDNNPQSAEALARRGLFHLNIRQDLAAARADMELADSLQPENPQVRLLLAEGWLEHGELDRAEAEIQALKRVSAERLPHYDIEPEDLLFIQHKALAILVLRREDVGRGVQVARNALEELTGDRRVMFLPFAAELFLANDHMDDARRCVEEYRKAVQDMARQTPSIGERLSLLQAAVAMADNKPYIAINLLEEVTAKQPLYPQVWRILWHAYLRTGQIRRAQAAMEAYVRRRPSDQRARLELARSYRDSGDFQRALSLADEVTKEVPQDPDAKLLKIDAVLQGDTGKLTAAELAQIATDLRKLDSDHDQAGLLLALIALKQGHTDGAIAGLREKAFKQGSFVAAARLAEIHAYQGDKDKAIEVGRAAIESFPGESAPWLLLANLHDKNGRPEAVEQVLREAVTKLANEEQAQASMALAIFLLTQDERNEGLEILKNMANERQEDVTVRLTLLSQPEIRNRPSEAQTLVDELRKIEGERGVRWRFEQARLWLAENDWKDWIEPATQMLNYCIRADAQWDDPVLVLGRLYEVLGRNDTAEEVYRRFFDTSPYNALVTSRLLELLARQRRFTESLRVLELVPRNSVALSAHQIKAAIGRADYDAAIAELEKRVARGDAEAASHVLLARLVYAHQKDVNTALRQLEAAAVAEPDMLAILSTRVAILHSEGRNQEALELIDTEVAQRKDYSAYLLRAEFYSITGQPQKAEQDYLYLPSFPDMAVEGYKELGDFYQREGRVDEAIAAWEKGVLLAPEHGGLNLHLVRALLFHPDTENQKRGRQMLETLLKLSPDDAALLSVKAGMLLGERDPSAKERAVRILERVVQLNPGDVVAYHYLIENARGRGELSKANQLAAQAIGANAGNVDLILLRAELEQELNNLLSARKLAKSVLMLDPSNVSARSLLARMALRIGDVSEAEVFSREAMQIDPKNEQTQLIYADVLHARGQVREAIQKLESYYLDPASKPTVATPLALADLYRMNNDFDKAGQWLSQAVLLSPDNVGIFNVRLRLLASQKQYDEIIQQLITYGQRYPKDAQMMMTVASILISAEAEDHIRRLKPLLDQFITANPDRLEGYMGLAMITYASGDRETALRAYRRILELDPFHQQALNNLAWILGVEMKKAEEALPFANKGVLRYPEDYHMLNTRGVLYYTLDMMSEARKDLEKCVTMVSGVPSSYAKALFYLGRINLKEGKTELARKTLQKVLNIDQEYKVLTEDERMEVEQLVATLP
ncbi:MAG: tetratricopeptide repeat protein [Phycisphaerales bacterium]|nr:tetratricopeptide repeat protein [Phycisphaerales bacterium]